MRAQYVIFWDDGSPYVNDKSYYFYYSDAIKAMFSNGFRGICFDVYGNALCAG